MHLLVHVLVNVPDEAFCTGKIIKSAGDRSFMRKNSYFGCVCVHEHEHVDLGASYTGENQVQR